jgi:glycosyltransferase involved in cell wall biosynthesis
LRVLYLSYTGLLEPLGQSQVLAYLRQLAREHRITLITFEKPADLADKAAIERQRAESAALGVRWIPLRYHQRPRLLATAWDLCVFTWAALAAVRRDRIQLLHCRSYIPSFVALAVQALTGWPFIFDMRALWPEEMIAAGRLSEGSVVHRLLKAGERLCLRRAAAVVSLTEAGVAHLRGVYGPAVDGVRFAVIPTCVDLERFTPAGRATAAPRRFGSIGTVLSGWFKFDWLAAFLAAALGEDAGASARIVTPEDRRRIAAQAAQGGVPSARLEVYGVAPQAVPDEIRALSAVAMFFTPGVAKRGSCPTRMGEVLACGVPVVVNGGVGDVEAIVRRYGVGVVVAEASAAAMRQALADLAALLDDPQTPVRCRRAAEDWFSLQKGAAAYDALYRATADDARGGLGLTAPREASAVDL